MHLWEPRGETQRAGQRRQARRGEARLLRRVTRQQTGRQIYRPTDPLATSGSREGQDRCDAMARDASLVRLPAPPAHSKASVLPPCRSPSRPFFRGPRHAPRPRRPRPKFLTFPTRFHRPAGRPTVQVACPFALGKGKGRQGRYVGTAQQRRPRKHSILRTFLRSMHAHTRSATHRTSRPTQLLPKLQTEQSPLAR